MSRTFAFIGAVVGSVAGIYSAQAINKVYGLPSITGGRTDDEMIGITVLGSLGAAIGAAVGAGSCPTARRGMLEGARSNRSDLRFP